MYAYLPPQYFQKACAHYKFPAIELLHGSPGNPEAWLTVLDTYLVNVFAGHAALQLVNSPKSYLAKVPLSVRLPAFWLAAGAPQQSAAK